MRSDGFSYVEALIAVTLMSVALAPILHSLAFPRASSIEKDYLMLNLARGRMEVVLAMDFIAITPGAFLSDSVLVDGKAIQRKVTVELYDINGDLIPEVDAKKITVEVEDIQLEALKVNY